MAPVFLKNYLAPYDLGSNSLANTFKSNTLHVLSSFT